MNQPKQEGTKPTVSVPAPEPMASMSVRIYKADKELLQDVYAPAGGPSPAVRRLLRRLADEHRRSLGWTPLGQPGETRKPSTDL